MLDVILGVSLVGSAGVCLWLYQRLSALKNLQYRESLERVESQEAYENLLFSVERERDLHPHEPVVEPLASELDGALERVAHLHVDRRVHHEDLLGPVRVRLGLGRERDRRRRGVGARAAEVGVEPAAEGVERGVLGDNAAERRLEGGELLHRRRVKVELGHGELIADHLALPQLAPLSRLQQVFLRGRARARARGVLSDDVDPSSA